MKKISILAVLLISVFVFAEEYAYQGKAITAQQFDGLYGKYNERFYVDRDKNIYNLDTNRDHVFSFTGKIIQIVSVDSMLIMCNELKRIVYLENISTASYVDGESVSWVCIVLGFYEYESVLGGNKKVTKMEALVKADVRQFQKYLASNMALIFYKKNIKYQKCQGCNGKGKTDYDVKCYACDGKGKREDCSYEKMELSVSNIDTVIKNGIYCEIK